MKLSDILCKVALALILLSFPVASVAQEPEPRSGVFCDTPEQLERFVALGTELGSAEAGYHAVNAEEAKKSDGPPACAIAVILGIRGSEVRVIEKTPEGPLAIVPFMVTHVRTPMGIMPAEEGTVWFGLATPKKAKGQGV